MKRGDKNGLVCAMKKIVAAERTEKLDEPDSGEFKNILHFLWKGHDG